MLLAQIPHLLAQGFHLLAEIVDGLLHRFNLGHDGGIVYDVGLVIVAEPEKVSVSQLASLVNLGLVQAVNVAQAGVRALFAHQRIFLAVIHGDVGECS